METRNVEKPNYRKFDEPGDKAFFAAYLNTAKQNLFIVFRDISEKLGLGFDLNDDDNMLSAGLWQKLTSNKEPDVSLRIIERIDEKFPFANYLAKNYAFFKRKERQAQPNDYVEVFKLIVNQLYDFRNFYTHAKHNEVEASRDLIAGMRLLFDASRRKVKERFELTTEEVKHLVRLERDGKGRDAKTQERQGFFYPFLNEKGKLTEQGFAFFTCLWLQRKDAQMFLKKLKGFKRNETNYEKATLETFTFYSLRLPQPKLHSDNSTAGVLLDMVNELKRCPKHLYPLLSEEDKKKFLKLNVEESSANSDTPHFDNEDEYEALPILKRKNNRFFYFALRYFDTAFDRVKFHVDLGNYCFHVYSKEVDNEARIRRWIKKMTAFGALDDFTDDKRPTEWEEKIQRIENRNIESEEIYLTKTTPHYHINGNNIGLRVMHDYKQKVDNNQHWPPLPDFDDEKPEETKPRTVAPDCWLSLYELPAMLFYQLLYQNKLTSKPAESIIVSHIEKIRRFFMEIENGELKPMVGADEDEINAKLKTELEKRELEKYFIPKPILKYLTSVKPETFDKKAENRLSSMLDETKLLLNKIKNQKHSFDQKPGSKDYVELKCGNMADFLARDIIRLQKPINNMKGKPNSTEFQVLQAKLAFFGANKETLAATFKNLGLIHSENPHPFLNTIPVKDCIGILDFYIKYLEKRKFYIEKCTAESDSGNYHFLGLGRRHQESGEKYIKQLAKELQTENVKNLPRGLFLKPILDALSSNENTKPLADELKQLDRVNAAYIIEKYFTSILNDGPQEFYGYEKSYDLLNKLFDTRKPYEMRKTLPVQFFSTEELIGHTQKINGKTLDNQLIRKIETRVKKEVSDEVEKAKNRRRNLSPRKIAELETSLKEKYWKKYKAFNENEKQIRLAKNCDMVLFMLADHILRKEFIIDDGNLTKKKKHDKPELAPVVFGKDYSLAAIKAHSDKGILELQTEARIELPYKYETNTERVLYVSGAKSVLSDEKRKTILREQIKIKNYGDFRALMKDRRISSLLPYLSENPIDFDALKKELELYEKARIEILQTVHNFESKAIRLKGLKMQEGNNFISHDEIMAAIAGFDPLKISKMKKLRNAFCHSQYPDFILFGDEINGTALNSLKDYTKDDQGILQTSPAIQFQHLTRKYYDELIEFIGPDPA